MVQSRVKRMALTNKDFWLKMMHSADITKRKLIGSQEINKM